MLTQALYRKQKLFPVNLILKTVYQNNFSVCLQPFADGGTHHFVPELFSVRLYLHRGTFDSHRTDTPIKYEINFTKQGTTDKRQAVGGTRGEPERKKEVSMSLVLQINKK